MDTVPSHPQDPMDGDVLDRSSIARLHDDVGPAAAASMVDRFLAMLPERLARLRRAVTAGDPPELRDATLSLACSATMLGAERLAAAVTRCRTADRSAVLAALAQAEQTAAAAARALRAAGSLSGTRTSAGPDLSAGGERRRT